ncbi:hypothetical protein ACUTAF_02095 [Pseudomonas sp. SP16.1]|uniref:hypothetical protein n=1 Tax=Pseudomonas sp. SP16.1 TaxID=3458854 RepID=UPI004045F119
MSINLDSYCQSLFNEIQEKWGGGKMNQTLVTLNEAEKQCSEEIATQLETLLNEAYPESRIDVTVDGFRRIAISQSLK